MSTVREAQDRLRTAMEADERPEVLHDLMLELAAALAASGHEDAAASVRRSAATLLPMFGMRDRHRRPGLWARLRRWAATPAVTLDADGRRVR